MVKKYKNILMLPALFIIGHLLSPAVYGQDQQVIVTIHPEYKETSYSIITNGQEKISLITYQTELNKGILRLRSNSTRPFKNQVDLLSNIVKRVFKEIDKQSIHTLFIGRLISAFCKNNTEMSERLALSADTSSLWDTAKGSGVSAHENIAVKAIANEAHIFAELSKIFAEHMLDIRVTRVEKVLIAQPDMIPFGDKLRNKGVKSTSRVPYDCLTWFSIAKGQNRQ